ncbi:MAG: bifunctional (p)ppGpp synthetase/guanosine-3',5'-bis(diphosphate) 3'-pyrophosphohydrolase [Chloroflexi bacterium]|nr:bifunctional (p)ppGpp synthetase/guanosine-3',5'-bis(diphosphate) 3'-pyrophosphohydrolase [Chloroflexota bacterium]
MEIDQLIASVLEYAPTVDEALLRRAYEVASQAHAGQLRSSGDTYISHPLAVASILAEIHMDQPTLVAGLLHDVVEDSEVTLEQVSADFGPEIAKLVDGVTKLERLGNLTEIGPHGLEEQEAESLRKLFLAMAEDVRVVLIKLADRLHNMRTLWALSPKRQLRMARETIELFAPLANRLGIWRLKWELEDLAFRYLDWDLYHQIAKMLSERRTERQDFIQRVVELAQQELQAQGIQATVYGRPKHIYSIYRKMQRKNVDFDQIYDLFAIRVIVSGVRDCYAALGIIHTKWPPIAGEFDDYIAVPKDNMYQSLHTAVLGPEGKIVEFQIRTEEMHRISEFGVAAHWRYKEGIQQDADFEAKIAWLRQLLEWQREVMDAQEFVDSLKTDVFQDRVYVFTPKGDIVDLPAGSTPLDFAYQIHTDIGHRCRGAKVNGNLVALNYQLRTGEQVEILTAKQGTPSRDWMNPRLGYLKTGRAQQKIRQWFRRERRDENIAEGKVILEKELRRLGADQMPFEEVAKLLKYDKLDDLLAAIGYGDVSPPQIATKVTAIMDQAKPLTPSPSARPSSGKSGIQVMGVGDLLTRLAPCCNPVPSDPIVGFITRGKGITVHRKDCPNVKSITETERLVEVSWGATHEVYPVTISIKTLNRPGILSEVAGIVAGEGVDISAANVITHPDRTATIRTTLEITNLDQLSTVMAKIEAMRDVLEARRELG